MIYLIKQAQKQNPEAFVQLIDLCRQDLYKVARGILKSDEDIADAIQDTILACYEKIHTLKKPKYFKTWLIRILINKSKDILLKNSRNKQLDYSQMEVYTVSPEANYEFTEVINSLDEKYRIILLLYYSEGFNTREIAEILDISENTVKTRLLRGRKNFAKQYLDNEEVHA